MRQILLILCLFLCACGEKPQSENVQQPTQQAPEPVQSGQWIWCNDHWEWIVDRGTPPLPPMANG